jgi:hypothetical protein
MSAGTEMLAELLHPTTEVHSAGLARRCVRIGCESIGIAAPVFSEISLLNDLIQFEIAPPSVCDIEVAIDWVEHLPKQSGAPVFDSGCVWTLHHDGQSLVFDFRTPLLGDEPYKRLVVNRAFSQAHLLLSRAQLRATDSFYPLEYPLDELLVTNWLGFGHGVEVHGCGLIDDTAGYLFLGHSGAGKSTTTELWHRARNPEILSDDRIILRFHDNQLWMYGTPWHGEAGFASARKAQVARIFILEHGDENVISLISQSRAVAELFARSFVPFHNAAGLDRSLMFLARIAERIPCYFYSFCPDESAVRTILNFHD